MISVRPRHPEERADTHAKPNKLDGHLLKMAQLKNIDSGATDRSAGCCECHELTQKQWAIHPVDP